MTALDDFLADQAPPVDDTTTELPAPDNAEQAEWYLRKLARLRQRAREVEAITAVEIARIRLYQETELGKLEREASFYEHALAQFHRAVLDDDPSRKTIVLPAGTLKARKHPDRWDVDGEEFVTWALANAPELLRTKHEPAKAEMKRRLAVRESDTPDEPIASVVDPTTGEPVPGVTVTPGEVAFLIDTEVTR